MGGGHSEGGVVGQRLVLLPDSEKVLGSVPGSVVGPFSVECVCSPCVCVGFLPESKKLRFISDCKMAV